MHLIEYIGERTVDLKKIKFKDRMFIFSWKKINKFKLRNRICLLLIGKTFFS